MVGLAPHRLDCKTFHNIPTLVPNAYIRAQLNNRKFYLSAFIICVYIGGGCDVRWVGLVVKSRNLISHFTTQLLFS